MKMILILSLLFIATAGNRTEARCIACEKEVIHTAEKLRKELKNIDQTLEGLLKVVETVLQENKQLAQELKRCNTLRRSK